MLAEMLAGTSVEQFVLPQLPAEMYAIDQYDQYHICFSGGADSLAVALIMKYGYKIPTEKMVLVHMRVDGDPSVNRQLFDWPQTDEYLKYASRMLDIPLVVIWGDMSLEERIRDRKMFPDKSCRFCTSYTKRDVYAKWARQFDDCKILLLTGERSEESTDRAKEPVFEYHFRRTPRNERIGKCIGLDLSRIYSNPRYGNWPPITALSFIRVINGFLVVAAASASSTHPPKWSGYPACIRKIGNTSNGWNSILATP